MLENGIDKIAGGSDLSYSFPITREIRNSSKSYLEDERYERVKGIGGFLPRLTQMFYDLGILVPEHYPINEMPDTDFTYANIEENYSRNQVLLQKSSDNRQDCQKTPAFWPKSKIAKIYP